MHLYLNGICIARSAETDASLRHILGLRLVELKHLVTKAEFDLIQRAKEAGLEPRREFAPYQQNQNDPMQGPSNAVVQNQQILGFV